MIDNKFIVAVRKTAKDIDKKLVWLVERASQFDFGPLMNGSWHKGLVVSFAEAALERDDLSEFERREIAQDLAQFKRDFDEIIKSEDGCNKDIVLRVVLQITSLCAAYGLPKDKLDEFREAAKRARDDETARQARDVRAAQNANRDSRLCAAIKAELGTNKPADSAKLAESILAGVKTRLGSNSSSWPSARTVQRRLAEMSATLSKCGKS